MQTKIPIYQRHTWIFDLITLSLFLGVLYFSFLGHRPLLVPDEARYSEVAREMAVSQNYITPTLDGVEYFEKPVLFYWLTASVMHVGGSTILAARLVNACLGVLCCLVAYYTARKLYDRRTGWLASIILGTNALYFLMAHISNHDLALTVMLSNSLFSFILGFNTPQSIARRGYFALAFLFSGLAVLSKGLVGIVFPCMIIGLWMLIFSEWRQLRTAYWLSSLAVFFMVVLPWHIMIQLAHPEFFYFYVIYQQFMRYTTMMAHHYQPIWYFMPVFVAGFFPWVLFFPQAIQSCLRTPWRMRRAYRNEGFFWIWAIFVFLFFSFSKSKLISYILPVVPAASFILARYIARALSERKSVGLRLGIVGYLIISLMGIILLSTFTKFFIVPDAYHAGLGLRIAGLMLLIGSGLAFVNERRTHVERALVIVAVSSGLFLMTLHETISYIDNRTILPLATKVKPILKIGDEVIAYKKYYHDLPFYLERRVSFVGHFDEFDYGKKFQDTHDWLIDEPEFWRRWSSQQRVYCVMNKLDYQTVVATHQTKQFYVLGEAQHDILLTNLPPHTN